MRNKLKEKNKINRKKSPAHEFKVKPYESSFDIN